MPVAKIVDEQKYSIVSDYLGKPFQAYDSEGELVWAAEHNIYGKVKTLKGDKTFIPFRQLGQYEDIEVDLYYNRFHYYDCYTGTYISQDPIGLAGNNPNIYAYVFDSNIQVDVFGLEVIFDETLANMARQAHNVLREKSEIGFNHSTVAIAEVEVYGEKQLFASGNGATLSPDQRKKLKELGIPEENIFSGKRFKKFLEDLEATKLANHAERVIIRNGPEGAVFTGKWGISWAGKQRNESRVNCLSFVEKASNKHH